MLCSTNNIKGSESFSKQATQLIVGLNSSLWHIIVTQDPNNIQLVVEETNRNPGVNDFGLKTPVEPIAVEEFVVEPTLASVSNAGQFNYPPYVSPGTEPAPAPAQNSVVHAGPTKPPVRSLFYNFSCMFLKPNIYFFPI